MKFMTLFAVALFSTASFAKATSIVDCKVTEILDDNVYEESLSVEEYPDVTVRQTTAGLEVEVGSNTSFEEKAGDRIDFESTRKFVSVTAAYKGDSFANPVNIRVNHHRLTDRKGDHAISFRLGELFVGKIHVANLRCE